MGISLPKETGSAFWLDLRLIRQSLGISLEHVHRETRVPFTVLSEFETSGLSLSPRFNAVYLRSIVRGYCSAVGVDEQDGIQSLQQAESGLYQGLLARIYLGYEPPGEDLVTAPPDSLDVTDVDEIAVVDPDEDVSADEPEPPAIEIVRKSPRLDLVWPFGIAAAVLVLISVIWLISTREGKVEGADDGTAVIVSGRDAGVAISADSNVRVSPQSLIGDSLRVLVLASAGKLEPIRVQIDSGEVVPHWVEEGDSMGFVATNKIAFRGWLDRATIRLADEDWPMEQRDDNGRVVVTRDRALAFVDSAKNRVD